jgi:hypothetical protein
MWSLNAANEVVMPLRSLLRPAGRSGVVVRLVLRGSAGARPRGSRMLAAVVERSVSLSVMQRWRACDAEQADPGLRERTLRGIGEATRCRRSDERLTGP